MNRKLVLAAAAAAVLASCAARRTATIVAALPFDAEEGRGLAWSSYRALLLAAEERAPTHPGLDLKIERIDTAGPDGMPVDALEIAAAEKAAADPTVVAYFGSLFSRSCKLTIPILNRAGIAQFTTTATYAGLTKPGFAPGEPGVYYPTGRRTFFRLFNADDAISTASAFWAKDLGMKTFWVAYDEEDVDRSMRSVFTQTAGDLGLRQAGTTIVPAAFKGVDFRKPDLDRAFFRAAADEIAAAGADLVFFSGYRTTSFLFVEALADRGAGTRFMSSTVYDVELLPLLGRKAEGTLATFAGGLPDEMTEEAKAIVERYRARFGQDLGDTTYRALLGYDGVSMVIDALSKLPRIGRAELIDHLRRNSYRGLMNNWRFDQNGDVSDPFLTALTVENGSWKKVGTLRVR